MFDSKLKKDVNRLEWKRLDDAKARDSLAKDISNLNLKATNLKQNIDIIYRELDKARNLFKKDYHDTVRPKVDILSDTLADNEISFWNAFDELQKRIEKLEKKWNSPKLKNLK